MNADPQPCKLFDKDYVKMPLLLRLIVPVTKVNSVKFILKNFTHWLVALVCS